MLGERLNVFVIGGWVVVARSQDQARSLVTKAGGDGDAELSLVQPLCRRIRCTYLCPPDQLAPLWAIENHVGTLHGPRGRNWGLIVEMDLQGWGGRKGIGVICDPEGYFPNEASRILADLFMLSPRIKRDEGET